MQDLTNHLEEFTGATAVYIGKLAKPIKGVSKGLAEDADDSAHLTERAEELQFITHTEKAKMMKDQVLKKGQGVTFDVLKPQSAEAEKECPSYKLVPEVVREESMHYYEVPRLGSYLAIKLEYESCLHAESFDKGLKDYKIINDFNNDL